MRLRHVVLAVILALCLAGTVWAQSSIPQRIVSVTPSVTEALFALGVGDKVVGVTSWCTYPPEATERTIIGDAFNLNMEVLLSLQPDLVIGDSTLVAGHIEQLRALGIEVGTIDPTTLDEVIDSMITLGELVGDQKGGQALSENMRSRLSELTSHVPAGSSKRVFVEIWYEPLMTVGPGSFLDELINLAGGENIAADTGQPWPQFSEEQVLARDPEVIILTNYNKAEALQRPAWQNLAAYKTGDVYEVNPDLYVRSTPRLLDGLAELISFIHGVEL
ncbi:MAG TPA: cobalamin-binding protein [Firmicutes bacterium]|jgi:iron complex transport system substrate-binding protein|nr:cobalamin-binding protein [Bacillota bacterium]